MQSEWSFLRVAFSVVDPLGRSKAFVVRAPVEQTGVDVQRVQKVGGGPDHPDGHISDISDATARQVSHCSSTHS